MAYPERERKRRRRLLLFVAPAVLINLALLFSIERMNPFTREEIHLGYEGPLEIQPELTIIPDDEEIETFLELHRQSSLSAAEVSWVEEESPHPDDLLKRREDRTEEDRYSSLDDPRLVPEVHPLHKSIPRSETYKILHMVEPEYPPEALARHEEGEVIVQVYVNELGQVEYARVVSREGGPEFEESALKAIYQFVFEAPRINGEVRSFWHEFVIRFNETSPGEEAGAGSKVISVESEGDGGRR
jgi:TonB family protein